MSGWSELRQALSTPDSGVDAAGELFFALHTADPGEAGTQTTSEVAYTGYARRGVARSGGFTITGNSVSPAANVDFPACQAGSETVTATHFSIGVASTGAGVVLCSGPVFPAIRIAAGVTPRLTTYATITED